MLNKRSIRLGTDEIRDIVRELDLAGNKKINYSEFLTAVINVHDIFDESRFRAVFNSFDTNASGKITAENIYLAM